jgi:hypothetical protein
MQANEALKAIGRLEGAIVHRMESKHSELHMSLADLVQEHERRRRRAADVVIEAEDDLALQRRSIPLTRIQAWSRLPADSSSIEGIACRFNSYDHRCRGQVDARTEKGPEKDNFRGLSPLLPAPVI